MSNDLKDILSNSNKDIDNQQLMDYLSNQLSQPQQHELEKNMVDDPFVNDAVEGLQQMDNKNLDGYVAQLNNDLQKQIAKNKKHKSKRRWKDNPQTYIAVVAILILLILCYIMLKKYLDARKLKDNNTSGQVTSYQKGSDNKNILF